MSEALHILRERKDGTDRKPLFKSKVKAKVKSKIKARNAAVPE